MNLVLKIKCKNVFSRFKLSSKKNRISNLISVVVRVDALGVAFPAATVVGRDNLASDVFATFLVEIRAVFVVAREFVESRISVLAPETHAGRARVHRPRFVRLLFGK